MVAGAVVGWAAWSVWGAGTGEFADDIIKEPDGRLVFHWIRFGKMFVSPVFAFELIPLRQGLILSETTYHPERAEMRDFLLRAVQHGIKRGNKRRNRNKKQKDDEPSKYNLRCLSISSSQMSCRAVPSG